MARCGGIVHETMQRGVGAFGGGGVDVHGNFSDAARGFFARAGVKGVLKIACRRERRRRGMIIEGARKSDQPQRGGTFLLA